MAGLISYCNILCLNLVKQCLWLSFYSESVTGRFMFRVIAVPFMWKTDTGGVERGSWFIAQWLTYLTNWQWNHVIITHKLFKSVMADIHDVGGQLGSLPGKLYARRLIWTWVTDTAGQAALADDLSWHHCILLRLRGFKMLAFLLPPPACFFHAVRPTLSH